MAVLAIFLATVFYTAASIVEIPEMLKNKQIKELCIYIILLACGMTLVILKAFDIDIPNPSDWIEAIYSPVSELLKNILE